MCLEFIGILSLSVAHSDQLSRGIYQYVVCGLIQCYCVRIVLFIMDHIVELWILCWAVLGKIRVLSSFHWGLHIKSYILHTHTHPLLLAKSGLAYTAPSYFLSPIILLLLSVFFSHPIPLSLLSAQDEQHSHFSRFCSRLHGSTYIHTPSPTPPTRSLGCHCNSVGVKRHPCLSHLCSHASILFLLPLQSHLCVHIIQYPHTLHLQVAPCSWPIGFAGFYVTAGGVKLLSNNERKKERS